jgi:hypothetical protein
MASSNTVSFIVRSWTPKAESCRSALVFTLTFCSVSRRLAESDLSRASCDTSPQRE